MSKLHRGWVVGAVLAASILSACGGRTVVEVVVPDDAAAVPNPVEATDESLAIGQQLYTLNCAVCHGQVGKGDGPGTVGQNPPPADLTAPRPRIGRTARSSTSSQKGSVGPLCLPGRLS